MRSRLLIGFVVFLAFVSVGACSATPVEPDQPVESGGTTSQALEVVAICGGTGGGGTGGFALCKGPLGTSVCSGDCSVCNPATGRCQPNPSACAIGGDRDCSQCVGSGNDYSCAPDPSRCTGTCDSCGKCGEAFICYDNAALCAGNCDRCVGGGRDWNCVPDETQCPGTCSSCQGSGNAFSCGATGCTPGDCRPCGSTNKVQVCTSGCGWGSCVSGYCP